MKKRGREGEREEEKKGERESTLEMWSCVILIVINYKMITFFSNDNDNCNTILSLEGDGNGTCN